jgi:hypothetical protein
LPGGKRGSKLAAGADAEFGEDFPQVVGDGGGAEEQLRGDLRVGGAVAGQAGDQLEQSSRDTYSRIVGYRASFLGGYR